MIFMRHLGVKMKDKEIQINEKVRSLNNHSTRVPRPWGTCYIIASHQ
jgi:hypothetical protein